MVLYIIAVKGGGGLGICRIFVRKRMERMESIYLSLLWRLFDRRCVEFSTNQPMENSGASDLMGKVLSEMVAWWGSRNEMSRLSQVS